MKMTDSSVYNILAVASFALGACVASFLNVVIWRVPRGESIVSPPSHCPKCGAAIKWYQNIPILSWLVLRGKCANCHEPISLRYILIETLGGGLFLAAFLHFAPYKFVDASGWYPFAFVFAYWIWLALMIVGSMIDFDHKLLPDFVTVGGMILGVVFNGVGSLAWRSWEGLLFSLGGLAFGFGLLWLVRFFGSKAFGREAMGMGDVFLMGAVGALFGPIAVLFTLIVSSLLGSVVGLSMVALSKARIGKFVEIPYGPYICMSCLLWMFCGNELVAWYLRFLRAW